MIKLIFSIVIVIISSNSWCDEIQPSGSDPLFRHNRQSGFTARTQTQPLVKGKSHGIYFGCS